MVRNQGKRKKQTVGGKRGSDKVGKMGWEGFRERVIHVKELLGTWK